MKLRAALLTTSLVLAAIVPLAGDQTQSEASSPPNAPCPTGWTAVGGGATCERSVTSNSTTFRVPQGVTSVDVAVVGGGGSSYPHGSAAISSSAASGGGGGGEVKVCTNLTVDPAQNIPIVIGGGGPGPIPAVSGVYTFTSGNDGENSSFNGTDCVAGGGKGSSGGVGGASGGSSPNAGGNAIWFSSSNYFAGGGGGAGDAAGTSTFSGTTITPARAGNGLALGDTPSPGLFAGVTSSYGGGGAGGGRSGLFGVAGTGGGAATCTPTRGFPFDAGANTGGGGGSQCQAGMGDGMGDGGSGIVRIRFRSSLLYSVAPGTPSTPAVTASSTVVRVTPSANPVGGLPASYEITASPGGATCTVTLPDTFCNVTGLSNGTEYTFTATATNFSGTSAASTGRASTPNLAPGVSGPPSVVAGNAQAVVTPATPSTGGPVTSYVVTSSPGSRTCTVTLPATSCTVTGLTNGTSYTFTTVARGTGPNSAASPASSAVVPSVNAGAVSSGSPDQNTPAPSIATPAQNTPAPSIATPNRSQGAGANRFAAGSELVVEGTNLGSVVRVTLGGKVVEFSQGVGDRFTIRVPNLKPGWHNLKVQTSNGSVEIRRFLQVAGATESRFVVPGFAINRAVLTEPMKQRIRNILSENANATSIEITGVTMGPVRASDRKLALDRARATRAFIRSINPDVTFSKLKTRTETRPIGTLRQVVIRVN